MVTGAGAVARGAIRAHHRHRLVPDAAGRPHVVSGLEEAALAVVAEDLGSPWLDEQGRVVGLLVGAVAEPPEVVAPEGIDLRPEPVAAHAVSAPLIEVVWPLLRSRRTVPRAMLGVSSEAASEAVESHVCKGCRGGRVIGTVLADGPADRAGVTGQDVLLAIDGRLLQRGVTLQEALLPHRPGAAVVLDLVRRGEPIRVEVVLGARASE
jgi:S1-C subfamily serine protease